MKIRKSRVWYHLNSYKESEVMDMLEEALFELLILLFVTNVILTIISFILIITIVIITYKENHISANH